MVAKNIVQISLCKSSFLLGSISSLVMPNGDPQDGFFYPTLTLMMVSYIMPPVLHRGSYMGMGAHVLLNLLNKLSKR